jgi:hypothetical protein
LIFLTSFPPTLLIFGWKKPLEASIYFALKNTFFFFFSFLFPQQKNFSLLQKKFKKFLKKKKRKKLRGLPS